MQSPDALVTAIQAGNLAEVKTIIDQQPELINAKTNTRVPVTLLAAYYRQMPVFEYLMSQQKDPSIYEAVVSGQVEKVKTLLQEKPELLDAYADDGFTPLALACYFSQYPVSKLLVEKGADVNKVASNGSQIGPIHSAVAVNSVELVRLLLENGGDPNLKQNGGVTPLHSAAHRGNVPIIELLLQHGADTGAKMADGRTALDFARADGHEAVVKILEGK